MLWIWLWFFRGSCGLGMWNRGQVSSFGLKIKCSHFPNEETWPLFIYWNNEYAVFSCFLLTKKIFFALPVHSISFREHYEHPDEGKGIMLLTNWDFFSWKRDLLHKFLISLLSNRWHKSAPHSIKYWRSFEKYRVSAQCENQNS